MVRGHRHFHLSRKDTNEAMSYQIGFKLASPVGAFIHPGSQRNPNVDDTCFSTWFLSVDKKNQRRMICHLFCGNSGESPSANLFGAKLDAAFMTV